MSHNVLLQLKIALDNLSLFFHFQSKPLIPPPSYLNTVTVLHEIQYFSALGTHTDLILTLNSLLRLPSSLAAMDRMGIGKGTSPDVHTNLLHSFLAYYSYVFPISPLVSSLFSFYFLLRILSLSGYLRMIILYRYLPNDLSSVSINT